MNESVVQVLLASSLTLLVVARLVGRARATDLISRRTTCRELRRFRQLVDVCAVADADTAANAVAAALDRSAAPRVIAGSSPCRWIRRSRSWGRTVTSP